MRVLAINSCNYTQRSRNLNINNPNKRLHIYEQPQEEQLATAPSFRGKLKAIFGAIGGGIVGFAFGGPVGAIAGATLVGGIGSTEEDKDIYYSPHDDDTPPAYTMYDGY